MQEVNDKGQKPIDLIKHKKKLKEWFQVIHTLTICGLSIVHLQQCHLHLELILILLH